MCTTFVLKSHDVVLFAKNYDFYYGQGFIYTNKRNVLKKSLVQNTDAAFEWVSKYGSITFNQFGKELPQAGMNEKGLAIAQMALPEKEIRSSKKKLLNELQWMQYQLDNSTTVKEVMESTAFIGIETKLFPLHYSVCDAGGNTALVEFVDDKVLIYPGLSESVLTNCLYDESISYCRKFEGKKLPPGIHPLDRFTRAWYKVKEFNEKGSRDPLSYAFSILDNVKSVPSFSSLWNYIIKKLPPAFSYWSMVMDCKEKIIYFHTLKSKNIRNVHLDAFNFSCKTPVRFFDIDAKVSGVIDNHFNEYKKEENTQLIEKSIKPVKDKFSPEVKNAIIDYPENCRCMEGEETPKNEPELTEMY